ncbi:MAG TPA: DUF1573 domain-containing protein [Chitinophagaceae bacterium]
MKKILFVLIAAAGFVACKTADKKAPETAALTDEQKQAAVADSSKYTSIEWLDSTFLNLGKVTDGKVVEVTFRFKNTGDKPLVFANVTAGCGCTVPEKPAKPYLPGEEGVIRATFDSKGRKGENNKSVYVESNTNPRSQELKFRVEVTDK